MRFVSRLLLQAGAVLFPVLFLAAQEPGFAPEQPIPFRHDRHAASPCATCHPGTGVKKGIVGTVVCMSCHRTVARDNPAVRKLAALARTGKPIQWEPVYFLPDFAWFSHRRHRRTDCARCHGPVTTRAALGRDVQLTMTFCRDCHIEQKAKSYCGACHPIK